MRERVARRARWLSARVLAVAVAVGVSSCSDGPPPDFTFFDACDPQAVPDDTCYAERRAPDSEQIALAAAIAERYIAEHPAEEERWDWGPAVLMFSMAELYRVTGDVQFSDYYGRWIDHHIAEGYDIVWSDSCPPALAALALYDATGDGRYREVAERVLAYLDGYALRTDEGGISHLGALNVPTLWLDSLFMFGMVLTRWGEQTGDDDALDLMSEQLGIFAGLLQDDSGLMVHAHGWPNEHDTDLFWARGNAWVTVAVADYLRVRALRHERDDDAREVWLAQVDGVLDTQDAASGLWHTVLERGDATYLETSASALFVYGMARGYRYGLLDDDVLPAIDAAMAGLVERISRDGKERPVVTGISGPTTVGTFEDYAAVEVGDDIDYGVGAMILALVETSGLAGNEPSTPGM